MSKEVKVPVLPESVEDAVISAWHKKAGDSVKRDENLVDLETDKVVLEVPAPVEGVLKEIKAEEGETVTSGQVLALLDEGGKKDQSDEDKSEEDESPEEASEESSDEDAEKDEGGEKEKEDEDEEKAEKEKEDEDEEKAEKKKEDEDEEKSGKKKQAEKDKKAEQKEGAEEEEKDEDGEEDKDGDRSSLSPSARRLAEEEGVDPDRIPGTGRGGRVTKSDVLKFLKGAGTRGEERVKMTRLRSRIAERLKEAQNTAAILTSFNEVDLKAVMDLRRKHQDEFTKKHDIKLGFMSFFVKACCDALRKYPIVNASVEDDEIVYHGYQDIGIAVSTERGLMVPILRNAETMGLAEIERAIREYAEQAREGKIALEDLQGGTFTITNGGVFGSLISTPLINPPQSAILGMHNIKERPVVIDGEITIRPMMYIALSYDHRIIDGREAVLFLVAVKEALEDPTRLLLGI